MNEMPPEELNEPTPISKGLEITIPKLTADKKRLEPLIERVKASLERLEHDYNGLVSIGADDYERFSLYEKIDGVKKKLEELQSELDEINRKLGVYLKRQSEEKEKEEEKEKNE
jgi:vacuolar-type H+-ATPase subunit I/STV1